ncbi:MAG: class I SAM-dependent methyltransferase [Nitrosomonadales bacterium]|nr:class I SAM-dependent methyltransferase [Nitrosomonadales bacterium]
MSLHPTAPSSSWRTPPETRPDLNFAVRDLRRTFLRVADNLRWYEQTWLGVPIWQLPEDLVALQRIVFDADPKWIVETGTKFGGSAIFFASLLAMMGRTSEQGGGVITVDIHETDEARELLAERPHRFAPLVRQRLIGDAKAPEILADIRATLAADPGPVMVFLDDWHDGDHVYAELLGYSGMVTPGGILIVADTTFEDLADTPVAAPSEKYPDAKRSNPRVALRRFLSECGDFAVVPDYTATGISNFPDSVLRRKVQDNQEPATAKMTGE